LTDDSDRPRISLVAAVADTGVIGRGGALPWRLPADLKHFKTLTTGGTIVMGRRTFESIGRPLPNRRSVIITRQRDYTQPGALVVHSLDEAIQSAAGESELFIIGGRAIYETALPRADRLYLTRVHGRIEGDVFFPDWNGSDWRLVERRDHPADEKHAYAMTFETYARP
jgi:dihydrofolate reductase